MIYNFLRKLGIKDINSGATTGNSDGWIESRWDFWEEKDFGNATLYVNTSDPDALTHRIYYSIDGMETWSDNWYDPSNLTSMPSARWVKIITEITTTSEIFIRDISFEFPEKNC